MTSLFSKLVRKPSLPIPAFLMDKVLKVSLVPPAFLIVLLTRLLDPLIRIRFGGIRADRLGHFVQEPELYLTERECGMFPNTLDLFYFCKPVCNNELRKIWERQFFISPFVKYLKMAGSFLPDHESHTIFFTKAMDEHGLYRKTTTHVTFNAQEQTRGEARMLEIGIPKGESFVCLFNRDSSYLDSKYPGNDWSYHDYRDSSIQNYVSTAEFLASLGYYVLRVGAVTKDELKTGNSKIIDYSKHFRDEFMDLFLMSHCQFAVGSIAGLSSLTFALRKPNLMVNVTAFLSKLSFRKFPYTLIYPKILKFTESNKFLTFREMVDQCLHCEDGDYHNREVVHVENTSEEILEATHEFLEHFNNNWQESEEDRRNKERIQAIYQEFGLMGAPLYTLSSVFLKRYPYVLE